MGMVVLGSVFLDIKGYPDETYIPGGRNAGRVEYVHGGVSRNIAENLGNLGLHPVFLSLVDESAMGQEVIDKLNRHGVDTRYIRKVPGGMGTWLAVFDGNNDVCASISKRPDLGPIRETIRESGDDIFSGADSVLLEMDMNEEIVEEVFRLSEKYGKTVYAAVSNIRLAMKYRNELQRVGCFVCNQEEAGVFFARDLSGTDPKQLAASLADYLRDANLRSMVVTLGGRGAVWADAEGNSGVTQPQMAAVVDTTGAGDAFFTGVAAGLTYGKTLPEACEIGTRLAATVIGTLSSTFPRFRPEEFGLEK